MLRGAMAPKLTGRERQVLELVQELGSPHVLEILGAYHRRYEEPIEAASLVLALRRLLEKGLVNAERRPAPPSAAIDERVHFRATRRADSSGSASPRGLRQAADIESLQRLLELVLEETRGTRGSASSRQGSAGRPSWR